MSTQKIIDYIKEQLDEGVDRKKIEGKLLEAGWSNKQIEQAFSSLEDDSETERDDQKDNHKKQSISSEMPTLKRFTVFALVLVVVLAGGVFAYFSTDTDTGVDKPREEIAGAFHNMADLGNHTSTLQIEIDAATPRTQLGADESAVITERFTGSLSFVTTIDEEAEEVKLVWSGEGKMEEKQEGEVLEELSGELELEAFLVNDKFFGTIKEIPEPLKVFFPELREAEFIGEHILLLEDASEEFGEDLFEREDEGDFREKLVGYLEGEIEEDIDPEELEEFLTFLWEEAWEMEVVTVEDAKREEIGGTSVRRYDLDTDLLRAVDLFEKALQKHETVMGSDKPREEDVYYCVDSGGTAEIYDGTDINPGETECPEVFSEGEYPENPPASPFDTQIKSELTQIRAGAEQYYYEQEGSYENFEESETFLGIAGETPSCSKEIMGKDRYQIQISERGQEYATWGALCGGTEESKERMIEEFKEEVEEAQETLEEAFQVSIWTDGEYIHKIELAVDGLEEEIPDASNFEFVLSMEWGDFGESLDLREPEDFIELEELDLFNEQMIPQHPEIEPDPDVESLPVE